MKKLFLTLKILGAVLAVLLLAAIVYVAYVIIDYERLPDNLECTVDRTDNAGKAEIGKEYTIVTQNIGFGAYTPDFTFFMDGGKESRAESLESVISCID